MNFVLADIKKFLMKLENGQLEIEAGQWELHKNITSMKKIMEDLKDLKDEVGKMRLNSVQQLGLIKELQAKMDVVKQKCEKDQPVTVSESSVAYEKISTKSPEKHQLAKGYKKRKVLRSEEIIEITSQISGENVGSDKLDLISKKSNEFSPGQPNSECLSPGYAHNKNNEVIGPKTKPNPHQSTKDNILQRYLNDSAKYLGQNKTSSVKTKYPESNSSTYQDSQTESEYSPFWDDYSSRAPAEEVYSSQAMPVKKCFKMPSKTKAVASSRIYCSKCPRKFAFKSDFLKHKKEHQKAQPVLHCKLCGRCFNKKSQLKKHELIHEITSKNSRGFKCSYCTKTCSTSEKLTEHLRKCRTIRKCHFRK